MVKIKNKRVQGQAAIELAVFGAVLIFILGTIVRSAMGNGYAQNENFKAMRMAMLASWNSSKSASVSRNSASVLFLEDRLSPDFNKYGDLDRNPFIAQGSGTFTYELMYPLDPDEVSSMLPIMDVYINGQHFPFTTSSYVPNRNITRPVCAGGPIIPASDAQANCIASGETPQQCQSTYQAQCLQNQCLRNAREWSGGIVSASQFDNIITGVALNTATLTNYGNAIFQALVRQGLVGTATGTATATSGYVPSGFSTMPSSFSIIDPTTGNSSPLTPSEIAAIQNILQGDGHAYKLFFTMVANGSQTAPYFSPVPPASCSGTYNALCASVNLLDVNGNSTFPNTNGDMQYDLARTGNYAAVEAQFPPGITSCSDITQTANMRCFVAWQWAASAATDEASIGLDASTNNYPSYDIDGRLKEVNIYTISQNPDGTPVVSYEDPAGGDIDLSWDINSCSPRPGLQNNSQIYTFTKQGTYLQIKEGKLLNPETDQFVRNANQRDTIDLIQRSIQLSNNTGRFCPIPATCPDGSVCLASGQCASSTASNPVACNYVTPLPAGAFVPCHSGSACQINGQCLDGSGPCDPNPVEVCIGPGSSDNCFSNEQNIKSTCYDENDNMLFVRSRLEDRRGRFWMTDVSGQMSIK